MIRKQLHENENKRLVLYFRDYKFNSSYLFCLLPSFNVPKVFMVHKAIGRPQLAYRQCIYDYSSKI